MDTGELGTVQDQRDNKSLHQEEKGHSFEDDNVHVLDWEDRWFEKAVREAIYVKLEQPSVGGGGLRHQLCAMDNASFEFPCQETYETYSQFTPWPM